MASPSNIHNVIHCYKCCACNGLPCMAVIQREFAYREDMEKEEHIGRANPPQYCMVHDGRYPEWVYVEIPQSESESFIQTEISRKYIKEKRQVFNRFSNIDLI